MRSGALRVKRYSSLHTRNALPTCTFALIAPCGFIVTRAIPCACSVTLLPCLVISLPCCAWFVTRAFPSAFFRSSSLPCLLFHSRILLRLLIHSFTLFLLRLVFHSRSPWRFDFHSLHSDSESFEFGMTVIGHSLLHSLVRSRRSLARLLRTARPLTHS